MKPRSAIKTDLFANETHRAKIDALGDLLQDIESHIDFAALAPQVDRVAPRTASTHDSQHFEAVFEAFNTSSDVYADRGYPSEAR